MSLKRLHSDDKIIGILDAISSKTGETYENVTTTQMAALIRNISLGAKEVWIGEQAAYNQIPASEIDSETCYIIMASGQVVRCYAGTVIIYDEPVTWDVVINNRIITNGVFIDTGVSIDTSDSADLTWEYYLKCSNLAPETLYYGRLGYDDINSKEQSGALPRMGLDSSLGYWYRHWFLNGASGLPVDNCVPYTDHFHIHVSKPEVNGSINFSYFDDTTGNEVNLLPVVASSCLYADDRNIFFGKSSGGVAYTLEEFKFRWLT